MKGLISDLTLTEDVQTLKSSDSVQNAIDLFQEHKIGSVIIVDEDNHVKGIFTERDYVYKIAGEDSSKLDEPLEFHMTPDPKSVSPDDQIMKAVVSMRMGRFRHIIVKDSQQKLKGVLSVKDLLDWYVDNQ